MSLINALDNLHTSIRNPMVFPQVYTTEVMSQKDIQQIKTNIDIRILQSKSKEYDIIVYDIKNQHMIIDGELYDSDTQKPQTLGSWSTILFLRRQTDDRRFVLKLMRSKYTNTTSAHDRFSKEVLYQHLAFNVKVAPKIIKYGWCCIQTLSQDPTYFIFMEYAGKPISSLTLSKTILDEIYKKYYTLLTLIHMSKLDISTSNILYRKNTKTFQLIDFDPGPSFDFVSFIPDSQLSNVLKETKDAVYQL